MRNWSLNTLTGALALLASTAPAFASRGDVGNLAMVKHDLAEPTSARASIRIEGALSCGLGGQSAGQGCELALLEAKTGRIYHLVEAKTAMQLYLDGAKNVLIEGRLESSDTISVKSAQML